jgi:hypothetical protein
MSVKKNGNDYHEVEMKYCRNVHYKIKFPNGISNSKRTELIHKFYEFFKDEEYFDFIDDDYFPSKINYVYQKNDEDESICLKIKKDKNGEYLLFCDGELMN